jgi:hypothetical protein
MGPAKVRQAWKDSSCPPNGRQTEDTRLHVCSAGLASPRPHRGTFPSVPLFQIPSAALPRICRERSIPRARPAVWPSSSPAPLQGFAAPATSQQAKTIGLHARRGPLRNSPSLRHLHRAPVSINSSVHGPREMPNAFRLHYAQRPRYAPGRPFDVREEDTFPSLGGTMDMGEPSHCMRAFQVGAFPREGLIAIDSPDCHR